MGCKIGPIEVYLPENVLTNDMLAMELPGWDPEDIYAKIGIRQRHVAAEGETALDLGEKACRKLFSHHDPAGIDLLLFCTQSPDHFVPNCASLLHERLGLAARAGALDFALGCSGFVYGLATAKGLIEAGVAEKILLVNAETMTKHIYPGDRANRSLAGDAATAVIIAADPDHHILEFALGTDGNENDIVAPCGGMRRPWEQNPTEVTDASGNVRTSNHYYMNGHEVFNFTMKKVPILVREVLRRNNTSLAEVDFVIFHQANRFIIEHLRKMSSIPAEKFYINMEMTGNTSSCTIPIALKDSLDRGLVRQGDSILIAGFGIGYSWAGTIIKV